MILPIVAYGHPVLRSKCTDIDSSYKDLDKLIKDMWDTMYSSDGVGLAAPQIGKSLRLFIVDANPLNDSGEFDEKLKMTMINPKVVKSSESLSSFNEGCLSIPNIRGEVLRPETIEIEYYDENFNLNRSMFDGIISRVIQHEYDHIEGKLFTDKLSSFKRKIIEKKLMKISKGNINTSYSMKFFKK